ncbi:MAG: hypothetical protein LBQ24_06820 [Candidatus Peribacteria bacterium]|nr:hypothetical protein [Candidatus Peribacteria bacterium]
MYNFSCKFFTFFSLSKSVVYLSIDTNNTLRLVFLTSFVIFASLSTYFLVKLSIVVIASGTNFQAFISKYVFKSLEDKISTKTSFSVQVQAGVKFSQAFKVQADTFQFTDTVNVLHQSVTDLQVNHSAFSKSSTVE